MPVDVVADLLRRVRAHGALVTRSIQHPPWALTFADNAPLAVEAMLFGDAWVSSDGATPRHVAAGDVVLVRRSEPYTFSDDPATAPQVVVYGRGACAAADEGRELAGDRWRLPGPRTYGNVADIDLDGTTTVLRGAYEIESDVSDRLLDALPPVAVVPAAAETRPVLDLLAREVACDEPGQDAVLDRLLDLLLVLALRVWFARPEVPAPPWFTALADPVVGHALQLLHAAPAHRWTVAELGAAVGASRAALARRFTALVGEPPLAYLTGWRMALAAEMLREPDTSVSSVAAAVGYGDGFAFSAAFKRARGVPPSRWRAVAVHGGLPGRANSA